MCANFDTFLWNLWHPWTKLCSKSKVEKIHTWPCETLWVQFVLFAVSLATSPMCETRSTEVTLSTASHPSAFYYNQHSSVLEALTTQLCQNLLNIYLTPTPPFHNCAIISLAAWHSAPYFVFNSNFPFYLSWGHWRQPVKIQQNDNIGFFTMNKWLGWLVGCIVGWCIL